MSGYGYGGGYAVQIGPGYIGLEDAAHQLDGPGTSSYTVSSNETVYLHEYENGSLLGELYIHDGAYYESATSYRYDGYGYHYAFNNAYVRDAYGLPFVGFYSGQYATETLSATSGYFSQHSYSVDYGGYSHYTTRRDYIYSYSDGSYRTVDGYRSFERTYDGHFVSGSQSGYQTTSIYDASTGYLTTYHG